MIILPEKSHSNNLSINKNVSCLGVVLAGGLSSRMGEDKANLKRKNTDMLTYSKQLLTSSGINNIVISGQPSGATEQDILIADKYKEAGPMGGIASVIEQFSPSALFILPVDLPLMTPQALQKLKTIGELSQQACFYDNNFLPLYLPVNAHTENFLNTAFIIKNNNHEKLAKSNTRKGGPSMRSLLKQVPHKILTIDNPIHLTNTNTPEEWALAQKHFT